jgi:glycine hydroxymethyltransferase
MTLLDWKAHGRGYATAMVATAKALAEALDRAGVTVFGRARGFTQSHHIGVEAMRFGGGQAAAKRLRRANILSCGIGLPLPPVEGDTNGLRLGANEIVRWGMGPEHMPELAGLIARGLQGNETPETVASDVTALRRRFSRLHYIRA